MAQPGAKGGVQPLDASAVRPPADPVALVRGHWGIESQLHWRRDVLFHAGQTHTRFPSLGQTIACLNNLILGLTWRLGWCNLGQARRFFDAHLDHANRAEMTGLA